MARASAGTRKRNHSHRHSGLRLVPDSDVVLIEEPEPRCLVLRGLGHPDCPEFYVAVEAIEGVAQVLRGAMERAGRIGESIGLVEKSWNYRRDEGVWQWKARVLVPASITATAVELAKHLAGRGPFIEAVCLMPVGGYTVH